MKNIEWCLDQVKQHDYERYLTTLFMPMEKRPPLWALYAFNVEISKTRQVVSQATLGLIRLQWWRDTITRLYDGHTDAHQVLTSLEPFKTIWTKDDFIALIDAQEGDFHPESFETESAFSAHVGSISCALLSMVEKVEGNAEKIDAVAKAYGLLRALRSGYDIAALDKNKIIADTLIPDMPNTKTGKLYRKLAKLHRAYLQSGKDPRQSDPMLPLKLLLTR